MVHIKFFIVIVWISLSTAVPGSGDPGAAGKDTLLAMFWNLENFFDWRRDSVLNNESEAEFTSLGKRHWTRKKFLTKCATVSKAIFWIADKYGRLPDVIGIAEVENSFVLKELIVKTSLRKAGYGTVHFDSPDPRGIDVALLYRKESQKLLYSKPLKVENRNKDGPPLKTRDILLVQMLRPGGDSLAFLVNHHPSKYGGNSSWRRKTALKRLSEATDSLFMEGWTDIVAMGDFNDIPLATQEYSGMMENLALPLARLGKGTIKYDGKWELIDMFFVSKTMAARCPSMKMCIEEVPFLMVRDNTHSGQKPFRTYTGPRYSGGVSDHCPITLLIP